MDLVTVFGGSGFIGRYVVQDLAARGYRVRVAVRRPNDALHLKPLGDVGQVHLVQANIRDAASVARALEGATAAVNLVGILYQAGAQRFDAVQAQGPETIAKAAAEAGLRHLVHLSAIGADSQAQAHYARSKGDGEAAVRAAFPSAVILRPSIVFGPEDAFFNRFASMARHAPFLPLIGGATRFQPVYVGDVAAAVLETLTNSDHAGQTFELGGPRTYSFKELMQVMMEETLTSRPLLPIPFGLAKLKAFFLQLLPGAPLLTVDQVRLLADDNVAAEDAPGLAALGLKPTPVEAIIPSYLVRHRPQGQFSRRAEAP